MPNLIHVHCNPAKCQTSIVACILFFFPLFLILLNLIPVKWEQLLQWRNWFCSKQRFIGNSNWNRQICHFLRFTFKRVCFLHPFLGYFSFTFNQSHADFYFSIDEGTLVKLFIHSFTCPSFWVSLFPHLCSCLCFNKFDGNLRTPCPISLQISLSLISWTRVTFTWAITSDPITHYYRPSPNLARATTRGSTELIADPVIFSLCSKQHSPRGGPWVVR